MTFLKGDRVKIIFSEDFTIVNRFLETIFSKLNENRQTILIDPKRSWNSGLSGDRARVFQPANPNEFVATISSLNNYLSPRLNTIIVNDLHYFLRDYRGKSAKNVVINNRILAICLSFLAKIATTGVHTLGLTYENPLKKNFPLSHKIINYYNCDVYQIESFDNNQFKLRLNNTDVIYVTQ